MSSNESSSRKRPVWYQVTYLLAAHRAHLALDKDDSKLRAEAEQGARELFLVSGLAQDELRVQSKRDPEEDELLEFLERTVEPAAAVLLAGLLAGVKSETAGAHAVEGIAEAGDVSRDDVVAAIRKQRSPDVVADLLVRYASQGKPSYRVHYNLACYWSEASVENERAAGESLRHLTVAFRGAPRFEAPRLAKWARRDPTLATIRRVRAVEFDRLVEHYKLPDENAAEHPSEAGGTATGSASAPSS